MTTAKKRSRGRPRKFDVDVGVVQAQALFAGRGFDTVGMSEICETLGVTPTSLYAAFGNKLGLYTRAVENYANSTGRFVSAALAAATTPFEVWEKVLRASAEVYSSGDIKGCMVLNGALMSQDAEANALVAAQAEATQAAIAARLSELGDPDPKESAASILVLMRGLSVSARTNASRNDLDSVVDLVLLAKR